jgi:hypothetical protein
MTINELSNEEVLYIYFSNKRWLDRYEEIFEEKGIYSELNLLDVGKLTVFSKLTDDEIDDLKDSVHYDYATKINTMFEPIATLIGEVNPEVFKKIEESFSNSEV